MIHASPLEASIKSTFSQPVVLGAGEASESLNIMLRALEVAGGEEFAVSILMLNEDGKTVRCVAAPSLPKTYNDAIDGMEIGPKAGSCGTAAFTGRAVFVADIENSEYWADYKEIALAHGLRACWSTPIEDWEGKVIGTFAVYHHTPRSPTPAEIQAVGLASHALTPLLINRVRG